MSRKITEQATTTSQPTNFFVNVAGTLKQLTWAGFAALLSASYAALTHASRHKSGGADAIKLDELAAPTDVTTLNATSSAHGLMPKADKVKLDTIQAAADVTSATNVGSSIAGANAKTTPINADTLPLIDSAAGNVLKKVTWANVKATLKTYFDTLYSTFNGAYSSLSGIPSTFAASAHTHPLSELSQSGAATGQTPRWNGTAWAPATPSGGGGGWSISTPKVAYVETDGDNATAVIGDPAKPFSTAQAANAAIAAAATADYILQLGIGSFGTITNLDYKIKNIRGRGAKVSLLAGIHNDGAAVTGGEAGNSASAIELDSDLSCHLGEIYAKGSDGGAGVVVDDIGQPGGAGGDGNIIVLSGCVFTSVAALGGTGGAGGGGSAGNGTGGNGGTNGAILLKGCRFTSLGSGGGAGGAAGGVDAVGGDAGLEVNNSHLLNCIFESAVVSGADSSAVLCMYTSTLTGFENLGSQQISSAVPLP